MKEVKITEQKMSKVLARRSLANLKRYIGISLLASFALGAFMLGTDKSLWLLAVSHAYGLIAISLIDLVLGISLLISNSNRLLIPSGGWAFLTILLQIGDITTAPQYKMTMAYFARYLFGLWAFDALLITQGVIFAAVLYSRSYQKMLAKKKALTYFDMGLNRSRRDFVQIGGAIGALFLIAGILGAWGILSSPKPSASQAQSSGQTQSGGQSRSSGQGSSTLPTGAVANLKQLSVGSPVYFDYPSSG
jgi:hypothetical protein